MSSPELTSTRDIERWPLFLVLQTPSKSFRHCSLSKVMRGVLWEVKSMTEIFKSSNGGKLFLHKCKLELFTSKQIRVFVHKDLKGSLPWDFLGELIHEKTRSWKARIRLPVKGCRFWQRPPNTIVCTHTWEIKKMCNVESLDTVLGYSLYYNIILSSSVLSPSCRSGMWRIIGPHITANFFNCILTWKGTMICTI